MIVRVNLILTVDSSLILRKQETKRINNKISNNHFYHNAIIFKIFSKHFWSMLYINFYRFSFYC